MRRKFLLRCSSAYQGRIMHWLWGLPTSLASQMTPLAKKAYEGYCATLTAPIDGKSWLMDEKTKAAWTDAIGRRFKP